MSKKEEGKHQPTLVYQSFIRGVSRVRMYGIQKYGKSDDWRTTPSIRHFDAALRHIHAFLDGEAKDESSGLSHLYHAAANLMFEIERREGPRVERHKKIVGDATMEVTCPRCKTRDVYPMEGVFPCVGDCGYFIEPTLERALAAPREKTSG